ncbi:hypothetical protein [Kibdelosporangium philippinense]|uniref:hypothetical protein n=1 Tax=Kibdelosporangium philippinense TaxID=211113 RepID=UPI003608DC40
MTDHHTDIKSISVQTCRTEAWTQFETTGQAYSPSRILIAEQLVACAVVTSPQLLGEALLFTPISQRASARTRSQTGAGHTQNPFYPAQLLVSLVARPPASTWSFTTRSPREDHDLRLE